MQGWVRPRLVSIGMGAATLLLSPGSALAAGGWVAGADDAGDARVEARIVVHPNARAGERVRAGVQLRLDPGWHVYWKNPGDSGIATEPCR